MDWRRYRNICGRTGEFEPLRVEIDLAAPLAGPAPWVHLDALLAFEALHETHHPAAARDMSPTSSSRGIIDVPLPVLRDRCGVWQCSCLWLTDRDYRGRVAWQMRPTVEHMGLAAASQVAVTQGATRARREQLTVWPAGTMAGYLVGHERTVRKLLARVAAVGKKRSQGYGQVAGFRVRPDVAAETRWARIADGMAARPIPDPRSSTVIGVRPPYWYRPWWEPAVMPGAAL